MVCMCVCVGGFEEWRVCVCGFEEWCVCVCVDLKNGVCVCVCVTYARFCACIPPRFESQELFAFNGKI